MRKRSGKDRDQRILWEKQPRGTAFGPPVPLLPSYSPSLICLLSSSLFFPFLSPTSSSMVNMNGTHPQRSQHEFSFVVPSSSTTTGGAPPGMTGADNDQAYPYIQNGNPRYYPPQPPQQHQYGTHNGVGAHPSEQPHRQSSGGSAISSVVYTENMGSPHGGSTSGSEMFYPSPTSIHVSPPGDARYQQQPLNGSASAAAAATTASYFPTQSQTTPTTAGYEYYYTQPPQPTSAGHRQPIFTQIPGAATTYHQQNALGLSTAGGVTHGTNGTATSLSPQHRKRQKHGGEDDSDDEDALDGGGGGAFKQGGKPRLPGACARCKGLKIKCDFPIGAEACKKCLLTGNECTIPGRKKRKPPAKRDELIKQIRDKDSLIGQLLEQLEARSTILAPLSLQAQSPDSAKKEGGSAGSDGNGNNNSGPVDPVAQAALQAAEEKREKEIAEWIKKARATIEQTREAFNVNLLGGEANPVVDGAAPGEDDDDDDDEDDDDTASGEDTEEERRSGSGEHRSGSGGSGSRRDSHGHGGNKSSALPTAAPLGFIERMGRGLHKKKGSTGPEEENLGVSNPRFFTQSAKPYLTVDAEQFQLPQILARGIVTPKEVNELFQTYFDYMNLSTCLLDERLYTPEKTLYRSPFLFTVICAIASRYHAARKDLYPILMNHARLAAGTALISGRKSLEACQAYILMAIYPIPARRWSEDRSWMLLGCAIRMATDLNLHHPPVLSTGKTATTIDTIMELEGQSREILNRTRAWLSCFNIDKATSTQFGKPTTLREDWMFPLLQRNMSAGGGDWWCPSPFANKFDIHLCAYSALLREIASFHEMIYSDPTNPTGLNEDIDFEKVTYEFDDKIDQMGEQWFHRVDKHMDRSDPQCIFRKGLLQLEFYYNQLVALSFGFQHAFRRGVIQRDNKFLLRCYAAASRVVRIVVDELAPQKYMRYCPESVYIFATFASAFLLKLLRPKFISALDGHQQHDILDLVERLVNSLSEVAMDDRHAPKLYSRFLSGLLKKAHKILARGTSSVSSPASSMNDSQNADSPRSHQDSSSQSAPDTDSASHPTPEGQSYNMEGVQSALPQNVWPYGVSSSGDGDTLASMQFFGDQFWEEGLLPGFAWSGTGPTPANDNIIRDSATLEQELNIPLPSFSNPQMQNTFMQNNWNMAPQNLMT